MKTALQDMIIECGCESCRQKRMCNGVDLMNCYVNKKLTIHSSPSDTKKSDDFLHQKGNSSIAPNSSCKARASKKDCYETDCLHSKEFGFKCDITSKCKLYKRSPS